MSRIITTLFGVTLAVVACGEQQPTQLLAAAEEAAQKAAGDSVALGEAITLFEQFQSRFPQHESSAKALKMVAMLTQQQGDMAGAVAKYNQLLADYADSEYADEAQFMVGFIFEEHLRDLVKARQAYQKVIDNYPDSDLATSARQLLPHVGRPAEEWVTFKEGIPAQ